MGATNTTTYYNLSQFIGTDKPAWLQDYNGDMLKIDTAINNAKTAADSAANAASAAQNDATTALGDITTINGNISTINTTLGTAVGNINTINSLIGNGTPTTTDQTIIGAINEINARVSGGYILEKIDTIASVTADGVKTYSDLLIELHSAMRTACAILPTGTTVEFVNLSISGHGYSAIHNPMLIDKDTDLSAYSQRFQCAIGGASNTKIEAVSLHYSSPVFNECTIDFSGTVTNGSILSSVPTSGQTLSLTARYYQ